MSAENRCDPHEVQPPAESEAAVPVRGLSFDSSAVTMQDVNVGATDQFVLSVALL